jgi:hypothetical protein
VKSSSLSDPGVAGTLHLHRQHVDVDDAEWRAGLDT